MDQDDKAPLQEKQAQKEKVSKNVILGLIFSPFGFLKKLSDELHWSFVLGVVIVYGINQGVGLGLSKVSTQYYMKDEQKLQPSEAQVYHAMIMMPWIMKPLWGLLTDTVPIGGRRRRPYFIFAGVLGAISMITLSLEKNLYLGFALLLLICGSAGAAVGDVTIDACVTENSILHPSLAGEMQSLCGLCSSVGQLIGYTISGFLVHLVGSKGALGVLSVPAVLVIFVGMMIQEPIIRNFSYKRVSQKFADAGRAMWTALKCPVVWRPCLYMYLSLAVSLHIHEGMFYWYTDAKNGPSFSQEVVGSISAVGAIGSLFGVLLYQNAFRSHPFRRVLFWAQLLYGCSGMLDLILVLRLNLIIGVPDYIVVVFDAAVSHMIGRLKWMPLLVLSSKLCPSGIEGTFFALIMSIDHVGSFSASWAGGFLLHALNVTRTKFDNLWLAIVIRSVFRVLPIGILFLIPSSDPNVAILPTEMLRTKKDECVNTEMESLVGRD
ncbi:probable folate-biopterin transporter 3 [Phtheirospermum japonicum]|uniref:Probable folate-biopterin transporter 3 n=2 Tax=Phtheirospermum japonicum TaxID=374723 RepID=A0A830D6K9_9LAMI|nr:probable folate-biopterin transporter 3 [Phtheirospermum japonicum]